jgi:cysteinyl-tRNA synthetase
LANFWMHGYFLQLETGRMGKSLGNFITVQDLVDKGYDPLAYRYLCLNAHYRSRLTFNLEALDAASTAYERLREQVYTWGEPGQLDADWVSRFLAQVNDDLNMPRALAVAWDLTRSELPDADKKATILCFDEVLGLELGAWEPAAVPEQILSLVEQREAARKARDWARADALRDEIAEAGWEVRDTSEGAVVRQAQ